MRSIDVHAHLTPQCFWQATENGGDWHTLQDTMHFSLTGR